MLKASILNLHTAFTACGMLLMELYSLMHNVKFYTRHSNYYY